MKLDVARIAKALRVTKGWTQEQLARELSVTFGTVNGWENRKHRPIPALENRLIELAQAARVPINRPSLRKSTRKPR
jgi:transcriptional regulator with XRE-family HTH domain